MKHSPDPTMARALELSYLEIIPAPGIEDRLAPIADGTYVSITCSPVHGIDPTLELMDKLADRKLKLIPHVAARVVKDRSHLREILARIEGAGVNSVFCPGGDAPEAFGTYESSLQMLMDMADIGHEIEEVGVASHPEGHALVEDDELVNILLKKQEIANYLVTQMCFDPVLLIDWLKGIREAGVKMQAWLGLPGVADRGKLFKLSMRIGVGQSAKLLMRQKDLLKKMIQFKPYQPDELLAGLEPYMADEYLDIPGFHLFSFNDIERTERWRKEAIRSYGAEVQPSETSAGQGEIHA